MTKPTKTQLEKFIKLRNASEFSSNMQFEIDAQSCGFHSRDLGQAEPYKEHCWQWQTPYGLLVEWRGQLALNPENPNATVKQVFPKGRWS